MQAADYHSDLLAWTTSVLREWGVKPRKNLSQNFVVDPDLVSEVAGYVAGEKEVLEIGCGIGTLTRRLVEVAERVVCVEIDWALAKITRSTVVNRRLIVIVGDARRIPLTYGAVVSNLPYHIVSELIVHLARSNHVKKAVLTVQKEVADRLLSAPGTREYGRITILVNSLFKVTPGGVYPPSSFYPRSKVFNQVIVLERRRDYGPDTALIEKLTRAMFNQRRRIAYRVAQRALGLSEEETRLVKELLGDRRVYELSYEDFAKLAELVGERLREEP